MNKWEKFSWVILAAGILCNFGAFLMTNFALTRGYAEGNGTMVILYNIGPWAVFLACLSVWAILIYSQHKFIENGKNKWILPVAALILFGIDFSNDFLVLFFNIHWFWWFQHLLLWNYFILK